jgi:hypothetical protein
MSDYRTGLDHRCRDNDGEIRHKRNDTLECGMEFTLNEIVRVYGTAHLIAKDQIMNADRRCDAVILRKEKL